MKAYYRVTYKINDLEVVYSRDTIERAYYLYNSLIEDLREDNKNGDVDIKLEEVSDDMIAILCAKGIYFLDTREENKDNLDSKEENKDNYKKAPDDLFEFMWGISKEEYNESLDLWNKLTGDNIELIK